MKLRRQRDIARKRIKVVTSIVAERDNLERCHPDCPYVDDYHGNPECILYNEPLGYVKDKNIVYRCRKCLMRDRLNGRLISELNIISNYCKAGKYDKALKKLEGLKKRMEYGLDF